MMKPVDTALWVLCFVLLFLSPSAGNGTGASASSETEPVEVEEVVVEIRAEDGFRLTARWVSSKVKGPGVLLLHQGDRTGPETGYEELGSLLAQGGIHALVLDFRGYGGSVDARFTGQNWSEAQAFFESDVDSAIRFLANQPNVDERRLGIVGASIGGRHASLAARKREGVRALCLLSANLGASVDASLLGLENRALLCIAAEGDPLARAADSARRAFSRSTSPESQLTLYKGTDHGAPLFRKDPHLSQTIAAWLIRQLRESSSSGD